MSFGPLDDYNYSSTVQLKALGILCVPQIIIFPSAETFSPAPFYAVITRMSRGLNMGLSFVVLLLYGDNLKINHYTHRGLWQCLQLLFLLP